MTSFRPSTLPAPLLPQRGITDFVPIKSNSLLSDAVRQVVRGLVMDSSSRTSICRRKTGSRIASRIIVRLMLKRCVRSRRFSVQPACLPVIATHPFVARTHSCLSLGHRASSCALLLGSPTQRGRRWPRASRSSRPASIAPLGHRDVGHRHEQCACGTARARRRCHKWHRWGCGVGSRVRGSRPHHLRTRCGCRAGDRGSRPRERTPHFPSRLRSDRPCGDAALRVSGDRDRSAASTVL